MLFILDVGRLEMKISARNILKSKIMKVNHGAVNSEVILQTSGGEEVVAIITRESAQNMELEAGKEVYAVIKASNVMIAID
jgi:molybdopterin-binding protein